MLSAGPSRSTILRPAVVLRSRTCLSFALHERLDALTRSATRGNLEVHRRPRNPTLHTACDTYDIGVARDQLGSRHEHLQPPALLARQRRSSPASTPSTSPYALALTTLDRQRLEHAHAQRENAARPTEWRDANARGESAATLPDDAWWRKWRDAPSSYGCESAKE